MNKNSLSAFFKDCNPFKMFLSKAERKIRNGDLDKAAKHLAVITDHNSSKELVQEHSMKLNEFMKGLTPERLTPERRDALLKKIPSDSLLDSENGKDFKFPENKNFGEIIFHFLGMDKNWPLGRNLLGGFLVHSPEYPTYFIPAFTQAKATGDATDLKKGEGPRGIITGCLEGVAVGALVSGKNIHRVQEMVPYMVLGAAMQLFSSKVFPWLGEKMGRHFYLKRQTANLRQAELQKQEIQNPVKESNQSVNKFDKPAFKGRTLYNNYSTGMRI